MAAWGRATRPGVSFEALRQQRRLPGSGSRRLTQLDALNSTPGTQRLGTQQYATRHQATLLNATRLYATQCALPPGPHSDLRARAEETPPRILFDAGRNQGRGVVVMKVAELPMADAVPTIEPAPVVVVMPVARIVPPLVWVSEPETLLSPQ